MDGAREDQRKQFQIHAQGFGPQEWARIEGGIVGDADIFDGNPAREYRQANISDVDFAIQSGVQRGLDLRTEAIGVDHEGQEHSDEQQNYDDASNDVNQLTSHVQPPGSESI
jgi:hypothetical protein